jgi:hypothetical protein
MEIRSVTVKPYEQSIPPGLSFEVEIVHRRVQEAIISVGGRLESDDGKMLANLVEVVREPPKSNELGAKDSIMDSSFTETVHDVMLVALLEKNALEHLENRRMENKKGDVHLTLNLNLRSIENRARVSHLHEIDSKSIGLQPPKVTTTSGRITEGKIMVYAPDSQFSTSYANLWVLSGDGSPVFLLMKEQVVKKGGIRIPSTDWIHDYAPKLELGEYFIVEIPKGNVVKEAWNYIDKAEECYRRWDTKGAFANCREVGSLLDRTMKQKFGKESFISEERWGRVYQRFSYCASLDLHLEDIKKSQKYPIDAIKIGKTDVEFILITTKALVKYAEELLQEKA